MGSSEDEEAKPVHNDQPHHLGSNLNLITKIDHSILSRETFFWVHGLNG